jgi:tetratricopeptide (TPR) repeat protein
MTSEEWYQRGNDYSRKQDFQKALQCYMEAIALDPDSPAVEAKKMLDNIYSFYCRDMYNP